MKEGQRRLNGSRRDVTADPTGEGKFRKKSNLLLEQLSDEELMRIIRNGSGENTPPRLLTIDSG
jgi:hypothetical protein